MGGLMTGGLIDAIIVLVAIEAIAIFVWRLKTGNGPALSSLACNLLAGAFLLLALRNALVGASEVWIAACLLAAFVSHILDLRGRWESASREQEPIVKSNINATLSLRVSSQKSQRSRSSQTDE
jgi:hypothetical protein